LTDRTQQEFGVVCVGDEEFAEWSLPGQGSVCALGVFDGLHLGHRKVINTAVEKAREIKVPALAFTFLNHPRSVLTPSHTPSLLATPRRRISEMSKMGLDYIVALTFSRDFADLSAHDFVQSILVKRFCCQVAVTGFNYHFGRKKEGTIDLLKEMLSHTGAEAITVPPIEIAGKAISSTRIRHLIAEGDMAMAQRMLGRFFRMGGVVVPGTGRARQLGFPTANMLVDKSLVMPPHGVYAGRVYIGEERTSHPALVYHGSRPTQRAQDPDFDATQLPHTIEVHIIGGEYDLAGKILHLDFGPRIRPEERFPNVEALTTRLNRDLEIAVQFTKEMEN
jgi:riboflavin kinase / FMN adenylyltransferase